jgi:hypothetical protein
MRRLGEISEVSAAGCLRSMENTRDYPLTERQDCVVNALKEIADFQK